MPSRPARPATGTNPTRTFVVALFVLYLALLTWLVLWKLEIPWVGDTGRRVVKLVPFVSSATAGASDPVELVENLAIFVPFGLYLGLLAPSWPWWRVAGTAAGASLALEVAQYALAVGSTDVTDVVVNTAGGLAGFGLLVLARRGLRARTAAVMAGVCSVGTVLALLAATAFVASPVRLVGPPPGDVTIVGPGRPGPGGQ